MEWEHVTPSGFKSTYDENIYMHRVFHYHAWGCLSRFERGCGNQELEEMISNQALGLVTSLIQSRQDFLK